MRLSALVTALILTSTALSPAAGANEQAQDVLGLSPGMSLASVEEKLTSSGWTKSEDGIFEIQQADLKFTKHQVFARDTGNGSYDQLKVTYTTPPTEPVLIKVEREYNPGRNLTPYGNAVKSSLQKYGKPVYQRETNSAVAMMWYQGEEAACTAKKSINAYENDAINRVKQGGLDAEQPCNSAAIAVRVMKWPKQAGVMISSMTVQMIDPAEAGIDHYRIQVHASNIIRAKQQAVMEDSSGPEM